MATPARFATVSCFCCCPRCSTTCGCRCAPATSLPLAVTLATCLIAYFSFAKITASRRLGLLGALLYTLSAYRLTCVYTRAAVGRVHGHGVFPARAAGSVRHLHQRQARFGDWLPMALGMAAMVQSHLLSCELTALLLICFVFCACGRLSAPRGCWPGSRPRCWPVGLSGRGIFSRFYFHPLHPVPCQPQ